MNQRTQSGGHTLSSSAPHPFIRWFADITSLSPSLWSPQAQMVELIETVART